MDIAILGGGSWGTALAVHLAKKNYNIKVWEFMQEQARQMQEERVCHLLSDVKLSENIFISSKMAQVIPDSQIVLVVVPSDKVSSTLEGALQYFSNQKIIICSKGFGDGLQLLSNLVSKQVNLPVYCLYGPTHAEEVCKGMFSGLVLAGGEGKEELKEIIQSKELKVDLSDDIIGVQVAAALKNILAVFIGVIDGLNLGDNAKAFVMTKGLEEIRQIGLKMGSVENTFHGLAGMGDVIVTCGSKHSRNRHVGEQIGKGRNLDSVIAEMKMVAEGVTTSKIVPTIKEKYSMEIPLLNGVYDMLFNNKNPQEVLHSL
jgi:glycerol-3-phosphate dehydrogenase (NAD(P)+)